MKIAQYVSRKKMSPFVLAGLIGVSSLLFMLIEIGLASNGVITSDAERTWTIATASLLLFAVFVSVLLLMTETKLQGFWNRSMIAFLGLALFNALLATSLSGKSIGEAGSFKFLYLVVTIGFLVFISIVNLARKIVNFAEREEWNSPKQRVKKRS